MPVTPASPSTPRDALRFDGDKWRFETHRALVSGAVAWIIDYSSGGNAHRLADPKGEPFHCMDVSPDGHWVFSVDQGGTARLFSVDQGQAVLEQKSARQPEPQEQCTGIEWLGRGPHVGLVRSHESINDEMWLTQPPRIRNLGSDRYVCSDPQGTRYVQRRSANVIEIRELESDRTLYSTEGFYASFSPQGRWLAISPWSVSVAVPASLELWDAHSFERLWRRPSALALDFSPDEKRLLARRSDLWSNEMLLLLRVADGKKIVGWKKSATECRADHAWRSGRGDLLFLDDDGFVIASPSGNLRRIPVPYELCDPGRGLPISFDGAYFVSAGGYWRWSNGVEAGRSKAPDHAGIVGFSHSAGYLLDCSGSCDGPGRIVNLATGQERKLEALAAQCTWLQGTALVAQLPRSKEFVAPEIQPSDPGELDPCPKGSPALVRRTGWLALTRASDGHRVWIGPAIGQLTKHLCVATLDEHTHSLQILGCDTAEVELVEPPIEVAGSLVGPA